MKNRLFIIIFCTSLFPLVASSGQDSTWCLSLKFGPMVSPPFSFIEHSTLTQARIGLALSGGGTRGIAQIGVIAVLEENGIPIDYIVGTSIGAIIGGLYASGYTPAELLSLVTTIKWQDILLDTTSRSGLFIGKKEERNRHIFQLRLSSFKPYIPTAFTPGQKLSMLLSDLVLNAPYHANDFHNLAIPLQIVATDIINGKKVILTQGNLAEAMRASSAFPLLFEPVEKDSMLLIDGGLLSNIPVAEIRQLGVDLVIAVDTTSPLRAKDRIQLPWEIADQVTTIMQQEKNHLQSLEADVLISLQQEFQENINFSDLDSLYLQGREEARKYIPVIKEKLAEFAHRLPDAKKYRLTSWSLTGLDHLKKSDIEKIIAFSVHDTLTNHDIQKSIEKIYETGSFCSVSAQITMKDRAHGDLELPMIQVEFILKENPVIKSITFEHNQVLSDSLLQAQIKSPFNMPINYQASKKDLLALIHAYRDNGYSLARIHQIEFNHETGNLNIQMDEGTISEISVTGNESVKDYVVLRELALHKGQVFNHADAQTSIKNIFGTGLFSFVIQDLTEMPVGYQLQIHLKPHKYDLVRIGSRYDRERENRFFIEFVNQNLFGTGNPLSFHAQYGNRDLLFALSFRTDRIFNSYLSSHFSGYYSESNFFSYAALKKIGEYEVSRMGINFSIGQQIERLGNVSLFYRFEKVKLFSNTVTLSLGEELTLQSIGLLSKVDTRDRAPFATAGKYHLFQYEFNFDRKNRFFKFYNTLNSFYTIFKNHTFIPKLTWGTSELTTPFAEQFHFGGLESMYGLSENQMNGRHLFLTSLEYRFKLPLKLIFASYLGTRYDIGTVWRSHEDIKPRDFMQGIGLNLAIDSIIGPIQLAMGRNSSGQNRYYVSIGHQF